jgi:hypothetical protein
MFVMVSIRCHCQSFFRSYGFHLVLWINFSICLTILCTPIPIVFFKNLLTWRSHNHFVKIRYTTRKPIGRSVICSSSPLCYLPYSNNPSYLCLSFISKWHTYSRSRIRCGSYFFTIGTLVFNIKAFSVVSEMCSLVFPRDKLIYIISS